MPHSQSYREREELLIPPAQWRREREQHPGLLHQTDDPRLFMEGLRALLQARLAALPQAVEKGAVRLEKGQIRIPALTALDGEGKPMWTEGGLGIEHHTRLKQILPAISLVPVATMPGDADERHGVGS